MTDGDMARLPYQEAVVKETLRMHPLRPLLLWAHLSTSDVHLGNGMVVPACTTAKVNMWAIAHDPVMWADPHAFRPDRFLERDVDVRGGDLRLISLLRWTSDVERRAHERSGPRGCIRRPSLTMACR